VTAAEIGNCLSMQPGQFNLDREDLGFRHGGTEHAAQPFAKAIGIRHGQRRSGGDMALAVGLDLRHINAVKRGAAHQAQRAPQICAR
jgi:hypothetical protein